MGRSQEHLREREGIDSSGDTSGSTNDPVALTVPTKAGTAQVGQTLTGTNGTFRSPTDAPATITRAWLRNGTPISGATAATYVCQVADIGATIKFRNTATNQYGSAVSDSTATSAVIAA